MCGIAGIVALSSHAGAPSREELLRMAGAIHHRGPDAFGVFAEGPAGLAHTRLSIIDLSGGRQPMSDGRYVVTFNGEIFNYVELRAELVAKGVRFSTESDTEVLLRSWVHWGEDVLMRFDGQFAFGIWDKREKRLVLARDRLGVRPIHTCIYDGRLYFASEAKAIFAANPQIPRALDPLGIDETFTFWSPVAPRTAFAGVEELPPGHLRYYDLGTTQPRERRWFQVTFPKAGERAFRGTVEDAAEAVHEALSRAVSLRMLRADVPVGAYVSGGLDSSLVAALAQRATKRFSTFSIRFDDAEYDETSFQRLVSRELGTDHHELLVRREDIARAFPKVVKHAERPILRTAPAPLFLLSELVRNSGIKVVLTGEGADEVFAGYDLFREGKVRRFWAKNPASTMRPQLLDRLYPYLARSPMAQRAMARKFFGRDLDRARLPGFAHAMRWQNALAMKRLFSREMHDRVGSFDAAREFLSTLPAALPGWSSLAQDQWIEMRTLLSGYLLSSQGDRMLMAHSVEGRFPFLDTDVVDLACTLPDDVKLRVLDEKHVLKRIADRYLPKEVARRQKQPYRAPDVLALTSTDAREYARALLDPAAVARAGIFDPDAVTRLWTKCTAGAGQGPLSNADNMALTGVISTQLLHETFVARFAVPQIQHEDTNSHIQLEAAEVSA
ncbi:Asparagine synthetase [Labilithrix luteola]|uniref:asparagine synthase (glutamine-hydrolyzing) n=1 Tax=Labilithrix luteola TaxID=1391654 RepID=A0A0K1PX62_9BACT|nr:asparagine synthase (glutamine-hydrolyzing) [Labilithrix luteola]AKU98113.1 Asparagine synthetase [Labilithrix luteola]